MIAGLLLATALSPSDEWTAQLRAITYTSKSGDSVALSRAIDAFTPRALPSVVLSPRAVVDRAHGTVRVCFYPSATGTGACRFTIDLRAADVKLPAGTPSETIDDPTIGMTLAQLLAFLHADRDLDAKTLQKGAAGDVVLISAHETHDSSCNSGQCMATAPRTVLLYFIKDGDVVARAEESYAFDSPQP